MVELLSKLAGDCPKFDPRQLGMERCGVHYADLKDGTPPDVPPSAPAVRTLRVVK